MRNLENISDSVSVFGGLDRETDPQLLPLGKFVDGYNMITDENGTALRVRDGMSLVTNNIYSEPFKIMGGARGRLFTPPTIKPVFEMIVDEEYALRIAYTPNTGLYVNTDHPTQNITFSVYGGSELGVTGNYTWDFGDGNNTIGSATSVSHGYTTSGVKTVTVSAVGGDSNTYTATTTFTIKKRLTSGISVPQTGIPGTTTPSGGGGDGDGESLFDLKVNGLDGVVNLSSAGDVSVSWSGSNIVDVYVDGSRKSISGEETVNIAASRWVKGYAYTFAGEELHDAIEVRINEEEAELPLDAVERQLHILGPESVFSGDEVALTYEFRAALASGSTPEPVATTCDLSCFHDSKGFMTSGSSGTIYGETLSFVEESSQSNSDTILPVLSDGVNTAKMAIWAVVPEYPSIIGVKVIGVVRKSNDFVVDVINANGDPHIVDDPMGTGQLVYIKITANIVDSSAVDTNFSDSVKLVPSNVNHLLNSEISIQYNGAFATEDLSGTAYLMDGNIIPESVWKAGDPGICVVALMVKLLTVSGGFPAYPAWQELEFSVEYANE